MSDYPITRASGVERARLLSTFPKYGIHRVVDAVDSVDPSEMAEGVNATYWKSVWVDVLVDGAGTHRTVTLEVLFWSPVGTVVNDVDGNPVYSGGWVPQGVLADIEVDAADDGHASVLLAVEQRSFYLKATALGADAVAHVAVAGAQRLDL